MLLKHCKIPFNFICYTDDSTDIDSLVIVKDISLVRPYTTEKVFTFEKLFLIGQEESQRNFWVDLDILIHGDITELVDTPLANFTMIWNHWNNYETRSLNWYGKCSSCHVNSSFVGWERGTATWLHDYTVSNWDKIEWTYKSLDKYLFYQHHRHDRLSYWDKNIFANYNREGFRILKDRKATIFNTSHIKANNLRETGYELHETPKEVQELWSLTG